MENYVYIALAAVIALLIVGARLLRAGRRKEGEGIDPYVEALIHLVDGDSSAAFEKLQRAVRSSSAPTDAYLRLGRLLRERGEATKALQVHQSLTVKKDLPGREARILDLELAADYDALGRTDKAIAVLEQASKRFRRNDPALHEALVAFYAKAGEAEKAYETMRELKKLGSADDRKIALLLATSAENTAKKGNDREARKLIQKALKHDPDCAFALLVSGDLSAAGGDSKAAIESWKRVAVLSPDLAREALVRLEKILFDKSRFNEMEKIYRNILDTRPGDRDVCMALARFLLKQGRSEEAAGLLREFLAWHPGSPEPLLLLLSIHARKGDTEAIENLAQELNEGSGSKRTYRCGSCSFRSDMMRWYCPICNSFDSFVPADEK